MEQLTTSAGPRAEGERRPIVNQWLFLIGLALIGLGCEVLFEVEEYRLELEVYPALVGFGCVTLGFLFWAAAPFFTKRPLSIKVAMFVGLFFLFDLIACCFHFVVQWRFHKSPG